MTRCNPSSLFHRMMREGDWQDVIKLVVRARTQPVSNWCSLPMTQRGLAPRIFDALFARIAEEETRLVRPHSFV